MSAMTTAVDGRPAGSVSLGLAVPAGRLRAALAWSVATVVVAAGLATVVLHLLDGPTDLTSWWYGNVGLAATLVVPGLLIALRRATNPVGWLMLAGCLGEAVCGAGREYAVYGAAGHAAPGWLWLGWFADSCYLVGVAVLPAMLAIFPGVRPLGRWAVGVAVLPGVALLTGWVGYLFTGDPIDVGGREIADPGAGLLPAAVTDVSLAIGQPLMVLSMLAAIGVILLRLRRSDGERRVQIKWVAWAGSLTVVEVLTEFLPDNPAAPYTSLAANALLVAALGVAILRHRLLDIDVVINRTLMFVVLSALVVGGYVAIVLAIDALLGETTHLGPGLVATAMVAIGFAPIRGRVQRGVDRLLYGARREPYRVMTQLGRRLETDPGEGELAVVVDTVAQALKLPYAAILDAHDVLLASTGRPGSAVSAYPLGYQGATVGRLLVSPRSGTGRLGRDEERLLADLARQIGAAVHAVRLSAALQASRQRLVTAKEEERRRLRRDLHDGLGPKLAALGLKLDAARMLAVDRPAAAVDLLGAVKADIRETIEDIRRLVYGLRPPALDELGLVGAVREDVQRFVAGGGPDVVVEAPQVLPALPAAVEVAAYWIVNEAVTNVVRHAGARRCVVRLALDGELLLSVRDDGTGMPAAWRAGVGTASMAERAAELGGQLQIRAPEAGPGTEVVARIPLPRPEEG